MAEKRKKPAVNSGRAAGSRAQVKTKVSAKTPAKTPTKTQSSAKSNGARSRSLAAKPPAKNVAVRKSAAKRPAAKKTAAAPVRVVKPADSDVLKVIMHSLEDLKAQNVRVLNVRELTDVADMLVIASGNSDRHVRSIADRVVQDAKKAGFRPMGVEGERDGEWVLVDLQDIIVHIMLPRIREFYRLENLWDVSAARREAAELAAAAEG